MGRKKREGEPLVKRGMAFEAEVFRWLVVEAGRAGMSVSGLVNRLVRRVMGGRL